MQTHESRPRVKTYLAVFGALAVLTALTVGIAYLHLLRPLAVGAAALIALVKVSLIALFFMHLRFEGRLIYAIVFGSLFFIAALAFVLLPEFGGGWG